MLRGPLRSLQHCPYLRTRRGCYPEEFLLNSFAMKALDHTVLSNMNLSW